MTRADTLAAPARIDRAVAQELIDACQAYTHATEMYTQYESGLLGTDMWTAEALVEDVVTAQWRLEAAFKNATGWTPVFHPAGEDPTASPSSWTIQD